MIHLPCPGTATWWPGHSCLNACHTLSLPHRGAVMPAHTPRCHHFCGRGITVSIPAVYQCHHMVGSLVLMQVISQHYYMAAQKRLLVTMSCPSASKWWLRLPCFYDCRVLVPPHDTPGHTSLYIYHVSDPPLGDLGIPVFMHALSQSDSMVAQACSQVNHVPVPPYGITGMSVLFPSTVM